MDIWPDDIEFLKNVLLKLKKILQGFRLTIKGVRNIKLIQMAKKKQNIFKSLMIQKGKNISSLVRLVLKLLQKTLLRQLKIQWKMLKTLQMNFVMI